MPSTSRRRFVATAGASALAAATAGCVDLGISLGGNRDERVDTNPPGEPALPTDGGDWPQAGRDAANTSHWPDGTPVRDREVYWTLDAGAPGAVTDDAVVNVHERADAKPLAVRDPADASVRRAASTVDYGVNAPPAVADGVAVVSTFIETLGFDVETGDRLWTGPAMNGTRAPPTVAGGRAFVATGGFDDVDPHVRAFDVRSGEELWRRPTDGTRAGTPAVADGVVYVQTDRSVFAFDATSGDRVRQPVRVGAGDDETALTGGGRTALVVAEDVVLATGSNGLVALARATGEIRWRLDAPTDGHPVVADGVVYVGTNDGVTAYDVTDGVRRHGLPGRRPLAVVDDVCYTAGDPRGNLRAVRAAGGDAPERWQYQTPEVIVQDTIRQWVDGITPLDGALWVHAADGVHGLAPRN